MKVEAPKRAVTALVSADKKDPAARVAYAGKLEANGLPSAFCQQHPDLLAAAQDCVQKGKHIAASLVLVSNTSDAAKQAEHALVLDLGSFDPAYDTVVALAQKYGVKPADLAAVCLSPRLAGTTYAVAMPLGLTIKPIVRRTNAFRAHVLKALGMRLGILELSRTPQDPTSWVETKQTGLSQDLVDLAKGDWWGRAAHRRGKVTSDFTEPVAFTVR